MESLAHGATQVSYSPALALPLDRLTLYPAPSESSARFPFRLLLTKRDSGHQVRLILSGDQTSMTFSIKTSFLFLAGVCLTALAGVTLYAEPSPPSLLEGCPFTQIKGRLYHYIFPGPPNYESVEGGDRPDPRWVLEIDKETYLRLVQMIPLMEEFYQPYIPEDEKVTSGDVIQLAQSNEIVQQFRKLENTEVSLEGYIGGWPTAHCHTRFFFEVKTVLPLVK